MKTIKTKVVKRAEEPREPEAQDEQEEIELPRGIPPATVHGAWAQHDVLVWSLRHRLAEAVECLDRAIVGCGGDFNSPNPNDLQSKLRDVEAVLKDIDQWADLHWVARDTWLDWRAAHGLDTDDQKS